LLGQSLLGKNHELVILNDIALTLMIIVYHQYFKTLLWKLFNKKLAKPRFST
jgi:hypothetical protein